MLEQSPMGVAIQYENISIINSDKCDIAALEGLVRRCSIIGHLENSAPDFLNQNQSTLVTITSEKEEGLHNIFWISTTDEALVLNLATRCSLGGCG